MLRTSGGRLFLFSAALLFALQLATPAGAQSAGGIRGKVTDGQSKPVEGAKILIEFKDANRRFETKTNKDGEFVQIGLASGGYAVTADKEGLGSQRFDVGVRQGPAVIVNFQLIPGSSSTAMSAASLKVLKTTFEAGVKATAAGNYDEAITRFQEAAAAAPPCPDCYYNIGHAYGFKKDYEKAEAAYKKAIELRPDYGEAYQGLATIYNAQKKFDQAVAATAEAAKYTTAAAAGGSSDSAFNQGLILWNAGKTAEAKKQFEEVVKANPNDAEAHYWLGMANLNEGKLPEAAAELDAYLKLAPAGQYAVQATGILSQIKK